ncbi:DUF3012 domain-containing protein [Vibrio sp. HB161653]
MSQFSRATRALLLVSVMGLMACSPEVGSEQWCQEMDDKPKGDWTANQVGEYAEHCIFRKTQK